MKEPKVNNDKTFEQIYLQYYSRMKRFALEYVVLEEDAENILQDVFLDLWEKRDVLFAYTNLIAFLFTAIKNRCINLIKRRVLEQEASDRMQEEYRMTLRINLQSLETINTAIFGDEDIQGLINKAIESLPPQCRKIFVMSKIDGKKQKEIAAELNISIHAVETQMGIAYKKLREDLKGIYPLFLFLFYL
ncbi:RNA polymerase sigma-70 factor [Massilibacteroides sp.]|uniref:RNA polymerase sigma-70 factor n=1 Tax=Massilibacteroides sp. TaxID=2034766 RepID=UPI0026370D49|nr:RNA polymerase sigma-70 factor [Massilibacteroides sp.]MDD4515860.1 RNA polymerase sigma-70 factor [Massilibacteroides sp.]